MKADKTQVLNTIIYARNVREEIICSSLRAKSNFYCLKCGQLRPFGGDLAIRYYGNPGVMLFCNDCLEEFERKLRMQLGKL